MIEFNPRADRAQIISVRLLTPEEREAYERETNPPEPPPTIPAAVLGQRQWLVDDEGALLPATSLGRGAWESSVTHARCRRDHSPPDPECGCGLWASWDDRSKPDYSPGVLRGWVAGSGGVQLYRDGWRAERAQILGLVRPRPRVLRRLFCRRSCEIDQLRAESAAARYGVPLWENADVAEARARELGLATRGDLSHQLPEFSDWRGAHIADRVFTYVGAIMLAAVCTIAALTPLAVISELAEWQGEVGELTQTLLPFSATAALIVILVTLVALHERAPQQHSISDWLWPSVDQLQRARREHQRCLRAAGR